MMHDVFHFSSTGHVSFTQQLQLFVALSVLFSLVIIALLWFNIHYLFQVWITQLYE